MFLYVKEVRTLILKKIEFVYKIILGGLWQLMVTDIDRS